VKRLRVGVLYGGRSGEHEVSLASAASVFANLDRTRYEPVPIRIEKDGRWALADKPPAVMIAGDVIEQARLEAARPVREGREVHFVARPSEETVLCIDRSRARDNDLPSATITGLSLDVIFPMLHGPYGEDGTIQGLLELANIPYVGGGVLASAVGMDKAMMKVAFAGRDLPICPYRVVLRHEWARAPEQIAAELEKALQFPMFVKPANLGSSVGISKAKDAAGLVAGEIIPSREFYDYEAKYLDEGSRAVIPAELPKKVADQVRKLAIDAFKAIDGAGMSRVDFLLERGTHRLYVNEVNTIPGFTTISMFAKLWAASGVDYPSLLDRLIALAMQRHSEKQQLRTSVT
jgi:D-alanine-D-alanine ligase